MVLLQAERHVVASGAPVAVELRPLSKGDRASRVSAVSVHAETEMLPVSHRRELTELAARRQQCHIGIREAERRERAQLFAELERELRTAGQDGIDDCCGNEVFRPEQTFRLSGEGLGERLHALRHDRQARSRAMTTEPLQERRTGTERTVEVERRDRAAGAFPEPVRPCDEDDRPVIALDEP